MRVEADDHGGGVAVLLSLSLYVTGFFCFFYFKIRCATWHVLIGYVTWHSSP